MKRLLSMFLTAVIFTAQMSIVFAEDTILKNVVLHSFDFAEETQITTDETLLDLPIISGGAEYVPENENIRFNAKSGAPTVLLNLSEAVTGEAEENVIIVEFDMNFGSYDGQSFTYFITSDSGEKLIDFRFEPYKSAGTGYLKVAGTDLIEAGEKTINQQLKDCIAYDTNKQDGMNADTAHFKNEINFALGTVTVSFSSKSKNGNFEGAFDNTAYTDIKSLNMAMSKANTSRYSYIDNIKISQMKKVDAPNRDELVQYITQDADGDLTVADTSKMVYGGHVSAFLVTTAKDGAIIRQYTTGIADSVSVNTQGADSFEITPVYTYTDLNDKAFNTAEGITLSDMSVLDTIENGYYDISVQKADGTLSSIYVNGNMTANAVDQSGTGRSTPKGSLCEFKNIYIENGAVNIKTCRTQADTKNGATVINTTYPAAKISTVTICKSPSIVNRKTKVFLLGDSLVCNYYAGKGKEELGSSRTGWGQQLGNFLDNDKYEVVNLAQSGYFARIIYETAFKGAIANSEAGDIIVCQCGYNDRVRSTAEEMAEYMAKMAEEAKTADVKLIFVSPPATCDDETKYEPGKYAPGIDTATEANTSYSYPVRLGQTVEETAKSLDCGFIDLSKYSYDYLTMLYGADIKEASTLYAQNIGVSDSIHLSYAGAMKWASFAAQELYDNGFINALNTDYNYSVTDTLGNKIVCGVSEEKSDAFDRFNISGDDENINVTVMAHTDGIVYAAMYRQNGSLIEVKSVKGEDIPKTMALNVTHEQGAYIKLFNWTENMEPLCGASKIINVEDINMNYSYDALEGKKVYAFGDSIVYGHNTPSKSFMRLIADDYGMNLTMLAKNGATVVTTDSYSKEDPNEETKDNYIINQIKGAPLEKPDIIIFDGYTNDAYGDKSTDSFNSNGAHINIWGHLGTIQGKEATEFDTSTFCGGFEKIIYEMRKKWGDTPIVFTTIHKSGGRDWETQCKLRDLSLEICDKWGVEVADIFDRTSLDTRIADQMSKYIINGAGSHPNVAACREFYIPVVAKTLNEVLFRPIYTLPDNVNDTVDIAVFAGQSNMSGRGNAADATVCDINAGFEYKSVSNPLTLVPIIEPFGLGEDRKGAIYDYNSDGTTKRMGSMVSAVVDEYYKQTGRQLVAVSASIGGTSTSEWKANYIQDAVKRLDDTKTFLAANKINAGRIFIVWCQGETDGDNNISADTYTANTKELFNNFKQHGAEKCFMIQIGHYRDGGTMDTRYGVIRNAQAALCENDSDFVLAGSLEPYKNDMKDKYHYNQTTYNAVGKTVGENISKFYGVN